MTPTHYARHFISSVSTDGKMLIWDPMATKTPVASITVGRPVNSACFSPGDPYAVVCAPELVQGPVKQNACSGHGSGFDGGKDDLIQIWDLRQEWLIISQLWLLLSMAFHALQHQ